MSGWHQPLVLRWRARAALPMPVFPSPTGGPCGAAPPAGTRSPDRRMKEKPGNWPSRKPLPNDTPDPEPSNPRTPQAERSGSATGYRQRPFDFKVDVATPCSAVSFAVLRGRWSQGGRCPRVVERHEVERMGTERNAHQRGVYIEIRDRPLLEVRNCHSVAPNR